MSWRDRIAHFFGWSGDPSRPSGVKPWPADDIDPIEELRASLTKMALTSVDWATWRIAEPEPSEPNE